MVCKHRIERPGKPYFECRNPKRSGGNYPVMVSLSVDCKKCPVYEE